MSEVVTHTYCIEQKPRRILLFAPPLYDVRFPWSQWHQPTSLLQLATALRRAGCDLRLVDALDCPPGVAPLRQLVRKIARGGYSVRYWRWGQAAQALQKQLDTLKQGSWEPEDIYLLSGLPHQWQGCHEAISLARSAFPGARIALYGEYPTLATEHALATSGADLIIVGPIPELEGLPLDLSLYPSRRRIAHLHIGSAARPAADLLEEFLARVAPKVRSERIGHIVLSDADAFRRFPMHIQALCQCIEERNLSVSLHAFGGVHPGVFGEDPGLAVALRRAGLKQVIFTGDDDIPFTTEAWSAFLGILSEAVARCSEAGYQVRTDDLVATVRLGRPREDLAQVTARIVELAHVSGSIVLLPCLFTPGEYAKNLPLEEANGRLFPFAEANEATYRDYLDVLGLGSILNAKYRTKTFDFLGDGLVERLVRESLITGSWRPSATPGQPLTLGYFGKDGKWVKREI